MRNNANKQLNLINENIRANKVRLIAVDGEQIGVIPIEDALRAAQKVGLDLVQITDSNPIVCKLMDYGKHVFEQKKAKATQKRNAKQIQVKEMKFRPGTEEGDYQVKLRSLIRFLRGGDKAKISVKYRGREITHQEIGVQLMNRVARDLDDYAVIEQAAKMEGRQLTVVLAPKRKK